MICTFNGKHRLEPTLLHAMRQSASFPFEILLVDNASNDGTGTWVEEYINQSESRELIRVVREVNPGLSQARLRGISESNYSIILFCDDDNWLGKNYLEIGFAHFMANPSLGALGGEGIPVFESKKPDWFDRYSHSFAVGDLGMKSGILPHGSAVYGAGCFFRRTALDLLFTKKWSSILSDRQGNALSSGGDVELCYAIQLMGFSVGFEKRLTFQHFLEEKRLTWEYYLRLKEGIASSFPLLDIYRYLLEGKRDKKEFFRKVREKFYEVRFAKTKLKWINRFFPTKERQLAERIQRRRWESYYQNKSLLEAYFDHLVEISSQ